MFDYLSLKSLTSVAPIRTLLGDKIVPFNKITVERYSVTDPAPYGIVLTLAEVVNPAMSILLDSINENPDLCLRKPVVCSTELLEDKTFRDSFIKFEGRDLFKYNGIRSITRSKVTFTFKYARINGKTVTLHEAQVLFELMRSLLRIHKPGDQVLLENVKMTYETLEYRALLMAYHFYNWETELK